MRAEQNFDHAFITFLNTERHQPIRQSGFSQTHGDPGQVGHNRADLLRLTILHVGRIALDLNKHIHAVRETGHIRSHQRYQSTHKI